jgi:hypothetical protein
VYDLDLSTLTTAGEYRVYIPGFGVSDPFHVNNDAYGISTGWLHQGVYNMRLGCNVNKDPGYARPLAMVDGVNGCQIWKSKLPGVFSTEGSQAITPTGAVAIRAGLGGYSDEGVLTITALTWATGVVTATVSPAHGMPIGTQFPLVVTNCLPSGYNFMPDTSGGATTMATIATATTFTYPKTANPGTATQFGVALTGFVTQTRATGYRCSTQDAGDNDDLACDHIYGYLPLAFVFNNIPASARFTPFVVQKCTELLNATLYAGTDSLPPLFHELFWYLDNYRVAQEPDGDIPGGIGYPSLGSMIPVRPEPIYMNRGWSALGNRTSQIVMGHQYAPEHWGTMQYAAMAAQLALICQGYGSGLATLTNTWRDSAIAAYNRARDLMSDPIKRDAYYGTELNLRVKMGWSVAQLNEALHILNYRAWLQQGNAAGALYRFLGSTAGQTPYGDFIEGVSLSGTPTIGSGGSGYNVGDLIVLTGGGANPGTPVNNGRAIVRVAAIGAGGAVTSITPPAGITISYYPGEYTVAPSVPLVQFSTTGTGTGISLATASFVVTYAAMQSNASYGGYDYSVTPGAQTAAKNYFTTRNVGSSATNAVGYTSPTAAFNSMILPSISVGGSFPNQPDQTVLAHMYQVLLNGISASRSNIHLQSLSGHMQWLMGANFVGKCFASRLGYRWNNSVLHEDADSMGVPTPPGIVPYGYSGWAAVGIFSFNGSGTNADGALTYMSDNTNGSIDNSPNPITANLYQPGYTKMSNNWRFGNSYWEHQPEGRGFISIGEYDLRNQLSLVFISLYLHGWDGNT